jgi:hypothetical protein
MSLPASSTEKNALVPVIATLLQLNSAEISVVQTAQKNPLWATLPVKEVKPKVIGPKVPSSNGSVKDVTYASTSAKAADSSLPSTNPLNSKLAENMLLPVTPKDSEINGLSATYVSPSNRVAIRSTVMNSPSRSSRNSPLVPAYAMDNSNAILNSNPLLDRSDTSEDIQLAEEQTPEIHM